MLGLTSHKRYLTDLAKFIPQPNSFTIEGNRTIVTEWTSGENSWRITQHLSNIKDPSTGPGSGEQLLNNSPKPKELIPARPGKTWWRIRVGSREVTTNLQSPTVLKAGTVGSSNKRKSNLLQNGYSTCG